MSIIKTVKVWLGGAHGVTAPIHISQYDTAWQFQFSVYNGDAVYSGSEATEVYMEGRKADGTVFAVPGTFSDGVATVECTASITAAVGVIDCELRISEDGETVGTANFEMIVEAAPLRGYVASGDDFAAMQQVLDRSNEAASDALSSKNAAAESAAAAALSAATAQVSVSNPFVIAATAATMTDHTKAYVYTGSETGYVTGGWYYWDGTAWTLGGQATDPTLSVAGAPADAASCGELKGALYFAEDTIGTSLLTNWIEGYIATNNSLVDITDVQTASGYWCQVAPCSPGDIFHIKTEGASTTARPWCWVMSDGTKISAATSNVVDTDITAPAEAAYLVCNSRYSVGKLTKGQSYIQGIQDMIPLGLDTSGSVYIPSDADLDTYTTPGTYRVNNNTDAVTIANLPVRQSGRLVVMRATSNNLYIQMYFARPIAGSGAAFVRAKYNTEAWQTWEAMSNTPVDRRIDYLVDAEIVTAPDLIATRLIDYNDGTIGSNSNFHGTAPIKIPDGTTAICINFYNSISGNDGYAFYDSNNAFISGGKNAESGAFFSSPLTIYPIPTGAKYIACCGRISYEESGVDRTITFINGKIKDTTNRTCGQTVVMLGDSIIGNYNKSDSVPMFLEQFSGAKCYNCGFGGSTMGQDTVAPVFSGLEAFNGWRIIHAIATNDYTDQLAAIADDPTYEHLRNYFADHVATLQGMDWSTVDVITMSYGTNDWGLSVTFDDNPNNLKDTTTFGGAFRTALEELWSVYPHIKVMLCGCIWRGLSIVDGQVVSSTDDGAAGRLATLLAYEDKIKSISEEYHVPFVPMYNHTNFNKYTWTQYFHQTDATHPARWGRYVIAKRYALFLAEL